MKWSQKFAINFFYLHLKVTEGISYTFMKGNYF